MIVFLLGVLSEYESDLINEIFAEANVMLYHISLKLLQSHADAEEAVSQAFLNIIDHIEKINQLPRHQIVPYCVVIVKNVSIDILRQRKKHSFWENIASLEDESSTDKLWKEIDSEQLQNAIQQLDIDEQYILELHFANEVGYKEIAKIIGVSEQAAKKRGQRAIKKLRSLYEEEGKNFNHV